MVNADASRSNTGVATGQQGTSADTPDAHSEWSCGRDVDGMKLRVATFTPPIPSRDQPQPTSGTSRHRVERYRYRLQDTTGDDLGTSSIPFTCRERTRQLQIRSLLSLLYGSCRYGTRTSQKTLKSLRRSGCGPCSPDTVSEMKSPTGSFGFPVYS